MLIVCLTTSISVLVNTDSKEQNGETKGWKGFMAARGRVINDERLVELEEEP